MAEPVYEPFDEDRVRLILLEETFYLMRTAEGRLRETLKEEDWHVAAAVIAAIGQAARERITTIRDQRRAG